MATMTIRNIDDPLKARLRVVAAMHGRSMEDEARDILRTVLAVEPENGRTLISSIRARLDPLGGLMSEIPEREVVRNPPDFSA